jgi:hypothetical protein
MSYRLLSVAESELAEAAAWYQAQAPGLGDEFLDEFVATIARVDRFPEAWVRGGLRHRPCLFRKFPYAVLYSHHGADVTVTGVIDLRRDHDRTERRTEAS